MEEIRLIQEQHKNGGLDKLRPQLCDFLISHREDFRSFRDRETLAWGKTIEPFTCLKLYILEKKTINFQSDMQSQIAALRRALSDEARRNQALDIAQFKQEWTQANAASWRARRILEIIFVLNQDRNYFLSLLSE